MRIEKQIKFWNIAMIVVSWVLGSAIAIAVPITSYKFWLLLGAVLAYLLTHYALGVAKTNKLIKDIRRLFYEK